MKTRALFLVLATLLIFSPALMAQEEQGEGPALLGRVIDSDTGTPLLGAFVHLQGEAWGVITDDDGRFRLPRLPNGLLSVMVEQLGYVELVQTVQFEDGGASLFFALTPDPILLEGIEVVMDRFERRRRAYAHASQLLDREELVNSSAFDLLDLIQSRSLLNPIACPASEIEWTCAMVRGQIRPLSVYVDEFPFWGGFDFLSMVQPHELHMVEIYYSRGQVRVYTEAYMERIGRRPIAVMPLSW